LSTAQAVDDQVSAALRDPEQFGQGKTWDADAGKAASSATALDAKLGHAEIPVKGTSSAEVAAWWKATGSNPGLQVQLIKDQPALIGALNGLPAMVRDKANRIVLAGDIAADNAQVKSLTNQEEQLEAEINARLSASVPARGPIAVELQNELKGVQSELNAAQSQLAGLSSLQSQLQATTTKWGRLQTQTPLPPMYLLGFDTNASGHAIVACGNPDTAKNVAVYVPGLGTSSNSTHFSYDVQHTENMTMQADQDTGAQDNATILWLGYNAPQMSLSEHAFDVAGTQDATVAVPDLTSFVTSLRTVNNQISNLTLVGHSYGSLVVGETAKASHLPVNNIVLVGSPGVSVNQARQLNIDPSHVWAGAAGGDPVAILGAFGVSPTSSDFGAHVINVNATGSFGMGMHGEYFDAYGNSNNDTGLSSLQNISSIIAGKYNDVTSGSPTGDGAVQGAEQGIIKSGF
jgi:pimeloyl-ACP methyl ester carboxylesterase